MRALEELLTDEPKLFLLVLLRLLGFATTLVLLTHGRLLPEWYLTTTSREILQTLEQATPGRLLGLEHARRRLVRGLQQLRERCIERRELCRRYEYRPAVQVPGLEYRNARQNRLVVGVEGSVGAAVLLAESNLHAPGRESDRLAHDRFVVHRPELRQKRQGGQRSSVWRPCTGLDVPPTISTMDESWVLIDGNTGLHVSWYFWLRVLDEVNRATRYGAPFALLLLDADAPPAKAKLVDDAASYVPAAIRSTDLGGTMGRGSAAVLLTHQDVEAADVARARILERLAATGPAGITWRTELLCYPDDGAEITNLLTGGWEHRIPVHARPSVGRTA